jgi:hypothetical protein
MALPLRDPQVLGVTVCALAKVAKVVIKIAGTLAAAAVMFLAIWLAIKAHFWALRQTVTHWRTSRAPARFRSSCRVPALWMSVTRTFTGRGFSSLSLLCVRGACRVWSKSKRRADDALDKAFDGYAGCRPENRRAGTGSKSGSLMKMIGGSRLGKPRQYRGHRLDPTGSEQFSWVGSRPAPRCQDKLDSLRQLTRLR